MVVEPLGVLLPEPLSACGEKHPSFSTVRPAVLILAFSWWFKTATASPSLLPVN
jgi:hypothetical protein